MRLLGWPIIALLVIVSWPAKPEDLIAQRPGLMCIDPKGLARLTMPDGSSKLKTGRPTQADQDMAFVSQCVEIPLGARMPMGERHHQTSKVYYQGSNGPQVYTIPNVDFSEPLASSPAEKSFAELKLHAAGFDLVLNRSLGLTCNPAEYIHGIGNVLDCNVPAPLSVKSAGIGVPATIPCAAGAVQLLPNGSFRLCKLAQSTPYTDYQQKRLVCPSGKILARDMSGGEPDSTAFCN